MFLLFLLTYRCDSVRQDICLYYLTNIKQTNTGFQALTKIRKSLREKRPGLGPRRQPTVDDVSKELESLRDDLQVSEPPI